MRRVDNMKKDFGSKC